jgi:uncharacterized protein YecT (DUF1311 family)
MSDALNLNSTDEEEISQDPEDALPSLDQGLFKEMAGNNTKLSRFILTFFPNDGIPDPKWLNPDTYFPYPTKLFDIWTGQYELCPSTKKLHAHVYVECKITQRLRFLAFTKVLRRFHDTVSIQSAKRASKKQRQCAINYVVDERKRAPDTEVFLWTHNKIACRFDEAYEKKKKASRTDDLVEQQRAWIESRPRHWSWDQIVHESDESKALFCKCAWGNNYHKGRYAEDKPRTIQNVVILYGAGGTGKSTMAHGWDTKEDEDTQERYYRRNIEDGPFWGGGRSAYKGQRVVHYEEFSGQEAFSRLKEVCDIGKQGPPINIKNGGGQLNHDTVVFTSNVHPGGWFRNLWDKDPKQFHPFWRRVTKILFYPSHKPDGSLNTPDEENLPYFIDQTEEWKEFAGDYNQCTEHASIHWPLKDVTETDAFTRGFVQGKTGIIEPPFFQYCKSGVDPNVAK